VNADVAPSGYLRGAVQTWGSREDFPGRTFAESDRIIGNLLSHWVTWKDEEKIGYQGRPMMLRVQMKQAKLFGFEFQE